VLLFTKKVHQDRLASGSKTIELRAGKRYAGAEAGDVASINGRFRLNIVRVERMDTDEAVSKFLAEHYAACGFVTVDDARAALSECYGAPKQTGLFPAAARPAAARFPLMALFF
jgi:hypothetical protein